MHCFLLKKRIKPLKPAHPTTPMHPLYTPPTNSTYINNPSNNTRVCYQLVYRQQPLPINWSISPTIHPTTPVFAIHLLATRPPTPCHRPMRPIHRQQHAVVRFQRCHCLGQLRAVALELVGLVHHQRRPVHALEIACVVQKLRWCMGQK